MSRKEKERGKRDKRWATRTVTTNRSAQGAALSHYIVFLTHVMYIEQRSFVIFIHGIMTRHTATSESCSTSLVPAPLAPIIISPCCASARYWPSPFRRVPRGKSPSHHRPSDRLLNSYSCTYHSLHDADTARSTIHM
jgi:hypothetical protein